MGRNLTDRAIAGEMLVLFGVAHTATLMGWALAAGIYGATDAVSFIAMPFGGQSTRYKRLADFKRLGLSLRAQGYELEGDPVTALVPVIAR